MEKKNWKFTTIFFCLNLTHQLGILLHIRRIVMRIVNRNSCHNKSYRLLNQIACQREKHDTYCTRNMLRANACLCNSNPEVIVFVLMEKKKILLLVLFFQDQTINFIKISPWNQFQLTLNILHMCLQRHSHSI